MPLRIAVIGGGVSASTFVYGLRHALRDGRASVSLFEIGRGPGGRAATRTTRDVPGLRLDHGTTGFLASEARTVALCDALCRVGALGLAAHGYGSLRADGSWEEEAAVPHGGRRYVGGGRGLAGASDALLRGGDPAAAPLADCRYGHVVRDVLPRPGGGWVLTGTASGAEEGFVFEADWVVASTATVAHGRWTETFGGTPPLWGAAEALCDLEAGRTATGEGGSGGGRRGGAGGSGGDGGGDGAGGGGVGGGGGTGGGAGGGGAISDGEVAAGAVAAPGIDGGYSGAAPSGGQALRTAVAQVSRLKTQPITAALLAFEGAAAVAWAALPWAIARAEGWGDVGRIHVTRVRDGLTTVAIHSTPAFATGAGAGVFGSTSAAARVAGAATDSRRELVLLDQLVGGAVSRLVQTGWLPESATQPCWGPHLHRWGAAFPRAPLLPREMAEVDAARLSFCGDYISSHRASSVEGAMVTALDAADAMERRLATHSRM